MKYLKRTNGSAFSLLETVVVLFIVSVGLVSILTVTVDSVRSQNLNKNSLVAYHLAAEGLELIKNVRDTNFIQDSTTTPIAWNRYIEGSSGGTTYRVDYATFQPATTSGMATARLQLATGTDAGLYLHDSSYSDSIFGRLITITTNSTSSAIVSSLVEWLDRGQTYQAELKSIIYDWDY
jgi:type II secretory pathway pseudopilin PulG